MFTANAPLTSTGVAAAVAVCAACEAVAVIIEAADTTLTNTNIPAACRVDSTCEVYAVRVRTCLAEFILASSICRHRVFIAGTVRAAAAARGGASIPAARAVLVALELYSIPVCAALRILRYTQAATALVIVSANEITAIVRTHVEFRRLRSVDFH